MDVGGRLVRDGLEPVFADDFTGNRLDESRWLPHYLPHWTTPDRSAARYDTSKDGLRLRIDADQPDWRPEDAPLRVSNLQTATYSGPVGSTAGTHRHRDDATVAASARIRRCPNRQSGDAVGETLGRHHSLSLAP